MDIKTTAIKLYEEEDWRKMENIMIFLSDKNKESFHCEICGANVFHHPTDAPEKYECNGCGERYFSNKKESEINNTFAKISHV